MNDLISVIVPIYKVNKDYLKRCILSIIKQTYLNLEIILIDDGSHDESSDLCDYYQSKDERIIVIHKENEGVSASRNYGLALAKGKWICFVDSDDVIKTNYIETLYQANSNYDIICSGHTKLFASKQEQHHAYLSEFKYNMDVIGTVWGKLYRYETIGKHRFNTNLSRCEDIEFNLRVFKMARYHYIDDFGYYYRYVENSAVHKKDDEAINKYLKTIDLLYEIEASQDLQKAIDCIIATIARVLIETQLMSEVKPRKQLYQEIDELLNIDPIQKSIDRVDVNLFSKTRRVPIIGMKKHRYELIVLPIYIRKWQYNHFRKGE